MHLVYKLKSHVHISVLRTQLITFGNWKKNHSCFHLSIISMRRQKMRFKNKTISNIVNIVCQVLRKLLIFRLDNNIFYNFKDPVFKNPNLLSESWNQLTELWVFKVAALGRICEPSAKNPRSTDHPMFEHGMAEQQTSDSNFSVNILNVAPLGFSTSILEYFTLHARCASHTPHIPLHVSVSRLIVVLRFWWQFCTRIAHWAPTSSTCAPLVWVFNRQTHVLNIISRYDDTHVQVQMVNWKWWHLLPPPAIKRQRRRQQTTTEKESENVMCHQSKRLIVASWFIYAYFRHLWGHLVSIYNLQNSKLPRYNWRWWRWFHFLFAT